MEKLHSDLQQQETSLLNKIDTAVGKSLNECFGPAVPPIEDIFGSTKPQEIIYLPPDNNSAQKQDNSEKFLQ